MLSPILQNTFLSSTAKCEWKWDIQHDAVPTTFYSSLDTSKINILLGNMLAVTGPIAHQGFRTKLHCNVVYEHGWKDRFLNLNLIRKM